MKALEPDTVEKRIQDDGAEIEEKLKRNLKENLLLKF